MTTDSLLDLWRGALTVTITVSAPFMLAGLIVGLVVAVLQTATQIQESILTFVPKLASALLVLALGGHWILDKLGKYATEAFTAQTAQHSELAADFEATSPIPP